MSSAPFQGLPQNRSQGGQRKEARSKLVCRERVKEERVQPRGRGTGQPEAQRTDVSQRPECEAHIVMCSPTRTHGLPRSWAKKAHCLWSSCFLKVELNLSCSEKQTVENAGDSGWRELAVERQGNGSTNPSFSSSKTLKLDFAGCTGK